MVYKKMLPFALSFIITCVLMVFLLSIHTTNIGKLLEEEEFQVIDGVTIYNSLNDELNNIIIKEITRLRKELNSIFEPFNVDEGLNIMIFDDLKVLQKYSKLDDVGAFYANEYNLISLVIPQSLNNEADVWFFKRDLRHEYTHYYLSNYLTVNKISDLPKWFDEGLAEYVAITMDGIEAVDPLKEIINFELLKSRKDWAEMRGENAQVYLQSHKAIVYIVENNDLNIVKKIIDDSKRLGFSDSFKYHTNIEVSQLHKIIN
ncbi:collagenase [Halalkalibacter oceani]|uniref:collagenase n=1 Tax=Halalkalibacter oceani TaxID=1653776 RepID=UPI00339B22CC